MISVDDDLLDPAIIADPYPYFRRLREERPVHWNARWRGWVVALYEDVYRGLHDDRMLADTITPYFQTRLSAEQQAKYALLYDILNSWIVFLDPPKHTKLRKLLSRAFTPPAVRAMRSTVEEMVGRALDAWEGRSHVDLIDDFSYPLPADIVALLVGAPHADLALFHRWADDLTNLLHGGVGDDERLEQSQRAILEFKTYLEELYAARLREPGADIMSWLTEVQRDDPTLRPDDVLYSCMLLLVAGHETTQNVFGHTMAALFSAPDQLRLLQQNPALVNTAIEEGMRFNSPMKGTMRVASEDLDLHGNAVKRGDRIMLLLGSANRDPAKFADPDRVDITRHPNPQLSFGHGLHFCMGAPLARLELEVGVNEILRRFPNVQLASAVRYRPRILSNSIEPPITLALG
ncbi:MAG: biotin biosynthesis cytochrome P450 [Candidatus Velthaea sp.]